ncbi:MAG: caspase family protein [Hyphomicrobium sp.]|nr:caspase family protein [Hyphomicrobium sp.]
MRKAFLLGNGGYHHLKKLENPARDIAAIKAKLESIGFDVEALVDRDWNNSFSDFKTFIAGATNCQEMVLYYCGHGVQLDGKNYIVPVDFDPSRILTAAPEAALVPIDDLLVQMKAERRIVFLDACRDSGGLERMRFIPLATPKEAETAAAVAGARSLYKTSENGVGRIKLDKSSQTLICFATEPGSFALDGDVNGMSPFSKAVSEQIDIRGLDVFLLSQRVARNVREATAGAQSPWTSAHLTDEFSFHPATDAPVKFLMTWALLTGFFGAILSFNLFSSYFPPVAADPSLIKFSDYSYTKFLPLLFGSGLAFAAYWWGRRQWHVPLQVLAIYWPVAVFCRWWLSVYAPSDAEISRLECLTLAYFFEHGFPIELTKTLLISILASALAGAATVFSGAAFSRELANPTRILSGAAIGASGAALFVAFLWGREFVNDLLGNAYSAGMPKQHFLWVEAVAIIALIVAWEMALAYNVGRAYAKPKHD